MLERVRGWSGCLQIMYTWHKRQVARYVRGASTQGRAATNYPKRARSQTPTCRQDVSQGWQLGEQVGGGLNKLLCLRLQAPAGTAAEEHVRQAGSKQGSAVQAGERAGG